MPMRLIIIRHCRGATWRAGWKAYCSATSLHRVPISNRQLVAAQRRYFAGGGTATTFFPFAL